MTLTVHLDRTAGVLRARIKQGAKFGEDLLAGQKLKDPECARQAVSGKLADRLRTAITIEWIELT